MIVPAASDIDFGCGPLDLYCTMMQGVVNGLAGTAAAFTDFAIGDGLDAGGSLVAAATDQAGAWLALSIGVMVITTIIGLAGALITGRSDLVKRTLLGGLGALPATYFALFLVGEGMAIVDEISDGLIAQLGGSTGFAGVFSLVLDGDVSTQKLATTLIVNPITYALIVMMLLVIGSLFLAAAMALRDFVLLMLIAFAPLAFVLLPAKGGDVWFRRWASAVIAALLARPLMIGTLVLIMNGFSNLSSLWDPGVITLAIGLLVVSFMPMVAFSIFSFAGAGGADAAASLGSGAARAGVSAVQQVSYRGMRGGGGGGGAAGGTQVPSAPKGSAPSSTASGSSNQSGSATPPAAPAGRPGAGPGSQGTLPAPPPPPPPPSSSPAPRPRTP